LVSVGVVWSEAVAKLKEYVMGEEVPQKVDQELAPLEEEEEEEEKEEEEEQARNDVGEGKGLIPPPDQNKTLPPVTESK
jgi:hypothetical protein